MGIKEITPDQIVLGTWGPVELNATILFTWLVMVLLAGGAWLITRNLTTGPRMSRWQNLLEVVVGYMRKEIRDISQGRAEGYLPLVGTLFLFVALSNLLAVVPGFMPPTASLSTTAALALCVLVAVPYFGVRRQGLGGYLRQYLQPSPLMLPMNLLGELSRTLALAVRLFGNIMSGMKIAGILLAVAPLAFPVVMQALGLLTGMIQAYIFAVLAMVYIASATRARQDTENRAGDRNKGDA
ncbi:MAG: F0F1 ATP synthase subunit A [Deltaproteobacteria bacterium]|nr:F0F1 ATP synthase subunit A [Deltaproteobacteria bacterium]